MAGTDGNRASWRFDERARNELGALQPAGQAALIEAMKLYGKGQALDRQVKKLDTNLYEIRVNVGNDPYRMLYFQPRLYIAVGLLAFYKNVQKTPQKHLDTARQRRGEWITRSGPAT